MAGKQFKVSVVVAVIDAATAKLRAINQAWSRMLAPVHRITAAVGAMGRAIGFPQIVRGFAAVGRSVIHLGGALRGLLGPMAAISVFSAGYFFARMFAGASQRADELKDMASKVGVTVEKLQELRFAAKMMGGSAEGMDSALAKGNKTLAEAAAGKNADAAALYRRLGISMRDSSGKVRNFADVLPQLAEAFEKNTNPAVRLRMAAALAGKEFQDMVPVLAQGRGALQAWMRQATLSGRMSAAQVEALADFQEAWKQVRTSIEGVSNSISSELAPVLTPLLLQLRDWADANRELIATEVKEFVSEIAAALRSIDFRKTVEGVRSFARGVGRVVNAIGGWKVALAAIGLVMAGPLLAALASVAGAVAQLGVILLANPIALLAAGLAGAAVLIITHWQEVKVVFESAWDAIKGLPIFRLGAMIADGIKLFIPAIRQALGPLAPILDLLNPASAGVAAGASNNPGGAASDRLVAGLNVGLRAATGTTWEGFRPDQRPETEYAPPPGLRIPQPGDLLRAGAFLGARQTAQTGSVDVNVTLKNAPPGTRVETESSGIARDGSTRVEHSMRDYP